jgi:hypothetical protein
MFYQNNIYILYYRLTVRDSSVSIAMGIRTRRPGFDSRQTQELFLYSTAFRTALGPTPSLIKWEPGAFCPRVNRPGRESNYSPPFSAELKNTGAKIIDFLDIIHRPVFYLKQRFEDWTVSILR